MRWHPTLIDGERSRSRSHTTRTSRHASRARGTRSLSVAFLPPFRLDLTVAALQRISTNPVEVWTADGRYLRAFETTAGPVVWEVVQRGPVLWVRLHGRVDGTRPWKALVRRVLGTDVDIAPFYALAARTPGLADLAERFRGVKPPRFASLWETFVNAIAFQQLSLVSGMASMRRLVLRCSRVVPFEGCRLFPFPPPVAVSALSEAQLRALGFSMAKARSLRAAAEAIISGSLREEELERLPSIEIARRLMQLPGIGPWTASLVLLRGMRRLESFPAGDSGAIRRFHTVFGSADPAELLDALGEWRGMLYFHLLLHSRFGVSQTGL